MTAARISALVVALALLAGCKIVKTEDAEKAKAESETDVVAATVDRIWEAEALPHIDGAAVPLADLKAAIAADLAAAGAAHGYRQESEGAPWNFAARIDGLVTVANTESRAATADVDVDGDGQSDAVLQLGPVIKGTALRDVLPFISFTDFRDQIEFAKLARALNARAYDGALADLARDALVGARIEAVAVFTIRAAGDAILATPVSLSVAP